MPDSSRSLPSRPAAAEATTNPPPEGGNLERCRANRRSEPPVAPQTQKTAEAASETAYTAAAEATAAPPASSHRPKPAGVHK
jgi:hypothetical protein